MILELLETIKVNPRAKVNQEVRRWPNNPGRPFG